MTDITPGTTFAPNQIVTNQIMNRLVTDAKINDGVIEYTHLSSDQLKNIINAQSLLPSADISGEDFLLIWDNSENAFKKVKREDLGGVVQSEGLDLSGSTASTVIDLSGNTTSSFLFASDQFSIKQTEILVNERMLFGGNVTMQYVDSSNSFLLFDSNELDPAVRFGMTFDRIDMQARKPSTDVNLVLSGRDADALNGDEQYNSWFIKSDGTDPELSVLPSGSMTDRDNSDADYQEPRIVLRGDVYVTDFDDIKVLPVQTDSTKSKLFVDELYNTDGEALITDGAVTASGLNLQADSLEVNDAGNLDIKVNPTGGLESTNAGLQLATSTESLSVRLNINENTGIAFVQGTTHLDRVSGTNELQDKFQNMTDAYRWINHNVASIRVIVDVIHETDCTEPNYDSYGIRTRAGQTPTVRHWSSEIYNALTSSDLSYRIPVGSSLPRVNFTASNSALFQNRCMFWFEHNVVIRGIHIVGNLGTQTDHFCAIRIRKGDAQFGYFKLTLASSGTLSRVFDTIDGGSLRFTNDGFHAGLTGHVDIDDTYRRGVSTRAPSLEFDGTGVIGGIGNLLFSVINTKFEVTDFRPSSLINNRHSRIHFSGNGTLTFTVALFQLSNFTSNILDTPLTIGSNLTLAVSGIDVFNTSQYNGISVRPTDGEYQAFPGANDFNANDTEGADYIISVDFHATDRTLGPIATTTALENVDDYY